MPNADGTDPDAFHVEVVYAITPLGTDAFAVNAGGAVAVTQGTQAYLFTPSTPNAPDGTLVPLGTLGGCVSVDGFNVVAEAGVDAPDTLPAASWAATV